MHRSTSLAGAAFLCAIASAMAASATPGDTVITASLPAAGRHETTVALSRWGRYSLRSSGEQPVALSVSDRRNGLLRRDGEPGQRHGRIDLFLDLGEYKLAVQGPKKSPGNATVTVSPFAPAPGAESSRLTALRENRLELDDLREASYWFELPSDSVVWLESAGRNLADMVVWRDGEWRVPVTFQPFTARPADGTPWKGLAGAVRLPKGSYRVGLYGGETPAWSERAGEHPAFMRMGLESLGTGVRGARTLPPHGFEEFLLAPGTADVVVEEADKQRLAAEITRLGPDFAPAGWMAGDSIYGKSSAPRILLHPGDVAAGQGWRLLKVWGAPGRAYTLQTFGPCVCALSGKAAAEWWVVSQHSGNPEDQIGASGVVVNHKDGSLVAVVADSVSTKEIARRFNLLGRMTDFIWIPEAGKYAFAPGGTSYRWSLGRYFHYPPANYAPPAVNEGAKALQLDAGLYLLTLTPQEKGIATFVLGKSTLMGGLVASGKSALGAADGRAWDPPRPEVRFPRIALAKDAEYDVRINSQSPELATVSARKLPLDPDEPVALWLKPGERVDLPLKLAGKRILSVRDARGESLPLEAGGRHAGPWEASGNLTVTLAGAGAARLVVLSAMPPERSSDGPAPRFPDAARAALPKFPGLEAGKPAWLDLDRGGDRTYALRVAQPGLYRLETTGRLETSLHLADRFQEFVRDAKANGVGRNALILEYLLPGDYQLMVRPGGRSAGHLGLSAARNGWVEAGALEPGIDNRAFVDAFSGAAYGLRIASAGRYRIESQGLNGSHSLRLEDKDGWPVEPAVSASPLTLSLAKGEYRLFSLPAPQPGRRVARLTALAEKRAIKGKGPHPLPLNTTLSSTWMDPAAKGPGGPKGPGGDSSAAAAPAVFTFSLPAPITARLSVSNGFNASLFSNTRDTRNPGDTLGRKDAAIAAWTGIRKLQLPAGDYRMLVFPAKKRNLAPYQVSVATRNLVPGLAFALRKKETFAVSLGRPSIVEFGSQGLLDVTAKLLDADGTVLAANDDGYLDWNFSISRALPAGKYFLRVESAEPRFTSTTVFMRALTDTAMDTLAGDGKSRAMERRLNRRLGIFPLAEGPGDVVACAAQGISRVGLSLERAVSGDVWQPLAQDGGLAPAVSVPRAPGARYRLKVWSEANADDPVTVGYLAVASRAVDAKQAASGLTGRPEDLGMQHRAWFKVDLGKSAPGHFRSVSEQNPLGGLAVATALDSVFDGGDGTEFSSLSRYAWIELRFEQAGGFRVKVEPLALGNSPVTLSLAGSRPRVLATKRAEGAVGLLRVEADGASPLAGPLAAGPGPRFRVRGTEVTQAVWLGDAGAATMALPGDPQAIALWNSAPSGDGNRPAAKLSWSELPLSDGGAAGPGLSAWAPGKPAARVLHLPVGGMLARVTLPPQGAVLLRRPDGSRELECDFDAEPETREYRAEGGDLYLLALDAKAHFEAAFFAAAKGGSPGPLAEGAGRGFDFPAEGLELVSVGAAKPMGLFCRGAVKTAAYVGRDGKLWADLADGGSVGPGGILALRHGAGKAQIDLCDASSPAAVMACEWAAGLSPSETQTLPRSSLLPLHDRVNWFAFALQDTQHVNLGAHAPLAAMLLRDGAPYRYQEAWERFNWDLPLPPGKYALGIRPFAGASLEGASLAGLFRSIPTVTEAHPFTAFLGPGESRLLRFDVARKADFGIGLRMGKETVEARLYDGDGRVVAQGKQQFVKLNPGAYHLWMRVPEGSEGTEVTALVFGQESPPNEPPERLVKWIIEGAQGPRPETAMEQAAEPDQRKPEWERLLRREAYGGGEESRDEGGEGGEGAANPEGGEGGEGGQGGEAAEATGDGGNAEAGDGAGQDLSGGDGQGAGDAGNAEGQGE
ncbi:MAG: hypothetical protein JF616_13180 [Fibrobacteres bacterium]|nr:hypothetical protein [Fibrobacterota bacterium]